MKDTSAHMPRQALHYLILLLLLLASPWQRAVLAHGAYHDVVAEMERALEAAPGDAELRFRLACAHEEHGEWTQALAELERVERLKPGEFPTAFVQGCALADGGHWAAARAALEEFLQGHPGHAAALSERGRVLAALGFKIEAVRDYEAALMATDAPELAWYAEAASLMSALGRLKEAAQLLRDGLTRLPDDPGLLAQSLEAEISAGDMDAALERVERLRAQAPRPEPWMARRAAMLAQAGRMAEARATWQALHEHLMALPNLERGIALLQPLLTQAREALGLPTAAPVAAPPAP